MTAIDPWESWAARITFFQRVLSVLIHCSRRRSEVMILHGLVREHLEPFLSQAEVRTGTGLPALVRDEFEAFLECGILTHGLPNDAPARTGCI